MSLEPRVFENERWMIRFCVQCGHEFPTRYAAAMFCTKACSMRTWRARAMLAGTHGYVGHQFVRVKPST